MRIHITGASGSGTTTLGAALAAECALSHLDADDYYWLPTTPPFQAKRDPAQRLARLRQDLLSVDAVVLSGSIVGWGTEVEDAFDLIVFLYLPAEVRVQRLREREVRQLGHVDDAFLRWAAQYDDGPPEGRSLARHQAWLQQRACPVLRMQADESVAQRLAQVRQAWPALRA